MSPDATAFAHLIDDGGYPRAVQRFLTGWHASRSRDVELPVEGPVTRVLHSPDGHWLACQVAPEGGTRTQIWIVTTDPDDRLARRIDGLGEGTSAGTAELIAWDGSRVAAIVTGEDGVGQSTLIDPESGGVRVLDRRSSGRLVDAWAGSALIRIGPRGYRDLIMLHGNVEIALLPADPGSTTDAGVILDDHHPRRLRWGPAVDQVRLYHPSHTYPVNSGEGYVRALIRSDNGAGYARLLEVTATPDGVSYHVVAERPGYELDEFAVSDDLSTVALLWNINGASELQILEYVDNTLSEPIELPGLVAGELSISAGGSMVAMTVEGADLPRTVELVNPRTREWERIERIPSSGPVSAPPALHRVVARDGLELKGWHYSANAGAESVGTLVYLHGGPEGQSRPGYSDVFPHLLDAGISVFAPNVRGSGGFGRTFAHADEKEKRFAAIDDVADCVRYLTFEGLAKDSQIICAGWSYGGYLTLAALAFHPDLFAAGISICGMSDLGTFYRNTEAWIAAAAYPKYGHPTGDRDLLNALSPLGRVDRVTAPLLVIHGAMDTNVPVGESEQIVEALRARGRVVRYVLFEDDGHEIIKRENRVELAALMVDWVAAALNPKRRQGFRKLSDG
jgi:dipeptidyl aminopeptidase/acylaminoacyl peptidase